MDGAYGCRGIRGPPVACSNRSRFTRRLIDRGSAPTPEAAVGDRRSRSEPACGRRDARFGSVAVSESTCFSESYGPSDTGTSGSCPMPTCLRVLGYAASSRCRRPAGQPSRAAVMRTVSKFMTNEPPYSSIVVRMASNRRRRSGGSRAAYSLYDSSKSSHSSRW